MVFVPGNHDEFARGFVGHKFGDITVERDSVHTTAQGVSLWVTHGDYFDGVLCPYSSMHIDMYLKAA